ncbi:hypothetical protein GPECTOR_8g48 [Gonium pectorale]|uniref:AP2/ERF domain-containing protein n=1 Tax=Gonium pectorale TaxID=33097 RepID=A0A150GTB1_GONPE|nr:hypothetical protein GPECTOR_8g48 [Gonium pectorale]|eukprot:KXZ53053.1 hypothetical protein GPECTOR_8g48 [Gonium pectorale]
MRGSRAAVVDEDYEIGADGEDTRAAGSDKQLTSQYRGVCWNRKNKRWQAAINSGKRYVYLGSFLSEYDAARAFDKAAVKLRGMRAKLNFPYSEYVDENGNLLEDPKMKDVMYKIDAVHGTGDHAGGGSGGRSGGRHTNAGGGGGGAGGAGGAGGGGSGVAAGDDHSGLSEGQMLQLPIPLPGLSAPQGYDAVAGGGASAAPAAMHQAAAGGGSRRRQPSPLQLAAVGPAGRATTSSDGGTGPEWRMQGGAGGTGMPPGGHGPALWPPAHPSSGYPSDNTPYHAFPEPVTTGPPNLGAGGGLAAPTRGSLSAGSGWGGRPRQDALGAGAGLGMNPAAGGPDGGPVAPTLHLGEAPGGGSAAAAAGAPPLPGSIAVGASGSSLHRTILRELPGGCTLLSLVPNRFANSKEDMCGAIYLDCAAPNQFGSSVWTGNSIIKMGLYDTERDARQAAIKCMQLYWAFCSDEWRVDFYNALAAMSGAAGMAGPGQAQGCGGARPPDAKRQRLEGPGASSGGAAGSGGDASGDLGGEVRAAHRMQLPQLVRQLQEVAATGS